MIKVLRFTSTDSQFPKIVISKYGPKAVQALFQNLFPMSNKKQPPRGRVRRRGTGVIESSDDRLSRASSCDQQIAVPIVNGAFRLELLEDCFLISVRLNVEEKRGSFLIAVPFFSQSYSQLLA